MFLLHVLLWCDRVDTLLYTNYTLIKKIIIKI